MDRITPKAIQPNPHTAHCQSTAATHFNEFLYNLAHMSSSVCTWGWVAALQIRRVRKLTAELWFLSLASNWNTPTVLQTIVFIFTIHPMTCQGFSFLKLLVIKMHDVIFTSYVTISDFLSFIIWALAAAMSGLQLKVTISAEDTKFSVNTSTCWLMLISTNFTHDLYYMPSFL